MVLVVAALLFGLVPTYAQETKTRLQSSTGAPQSKASEGCKNAEELVDQADQVISKLTKITPAALESNAKELVDTVVDLKGQAQLLKYKLGDCFNRESIQGDWSVGKGPMPAKIRMLATEIDYLNFVYQTRFTEGDKSYLADAMPADMEQITECKGVSEFLPKVDALLDQYKTEEPSNKIMPRDVNSYYDHGKQLVDCGDALSTHGYRATAATVFFKVAAIDNLMVLAYATGRHKR
jgi:hypothetical protein